VRNANILQTKGLRLQARCSLLRRYRYPLSLFQSNTPGYVSFGDLIDTKLFLRWLAGRLLAFLPDGLGAIM